MSPLPRKNSSSSSNPVSDDPTSQSPLQSSPTIPAPSKSKNYRLQKNIKVGNSPHPSKRQCSAVKTNLDLNFHDLDHGRSPKTISRSEIETLHSILSPSTRTNIPKNSPNRRLELKMLKMILKNERETESDEERSYQKSIKERMVLADAERRESILEREKWEQRRVNEAFFSHTRKSPEQILAETKYQQLLVADLWKPPDQFSQHASDEIDLADVNEVSNTHGSTLIQSPSKSTLDSLTYYAKPEKDSQVHCDISVMHLPSKQENLFVPDFRNLQDADEGFDQEMTRVFAVKYNAGYIKTDFSTEAHSKHQSSLVIDQDVLSSPFGVVTTSKALAQRPLRQPPSTLAKNAAMNSQSLSSYLSSKVSQYFHPTRWTTAEIQLFSTLHTIYGNDWDMISNVLAHTKSPSVLKRTWVKCEECISRITPINFRDSICHMCQQPAGTSMMIFCDCCDRAYHFYCTISPPDEGPDAEWFCSPGCSKVGQLNCAKCDRATDEDLILLCDKCDKGYHLYCLNPPLKEIPADDWFCDTCIVNKDSVSPNSDNLTTDETSIQELSSLRDQEMDSDSLVMSLDNHHPDLPKLSSKKTSHHPQRSPQQNAESRLFKSVSLSLKCLTNPHTIRHEHQIGTKHLHPIAFDRYKPTPSAAARILTSLAIQVPWRDLTELVKCLCPGCIIEFDGGVVPKQISNFKVGLHPFLPEHFAYSIFTRQLDDIKISLNAFDPLELDLHFDILLQAVDGYLDEYFSKPHMSSLPCLSSIDVHKVSKSIDHGLIEIAISLPTATTNRVDYFTMASRVLASNRSHCANTNKKAPQPKKVLQHDLSSNPIVQGVSEELSNNKTASPVKIQGTEAKTSSTLSIQDQPVHSLINNEVSTNESYAMYASSPFQGGNHRYRNPLNCHLHDFKQPLVPIDLEKVLMSDAEIKDQSFWIFKVDTRLYNMCESTFLLKQINWPIDQRYHSLVHSGDRVFIWESGQRAGIVALATVLTDPNIISHAPTLADKMLTSREWKSPIQSQCKILINITLPSKLTQKTIESEPSLLGLLGMLNEPFGTNFQLSSSDSQALYSLFSLFVNQMSAQELIRSRTISLCNMAINDQKITQHQDCEAPIPAGDGITTKTAITPLVHHALDPHTPSCQVSCPSVHSSDETSSNSLHAHNTSLINELAVDVTDVKMSIIDEQASTEFNHLNSAEKETLNQVQDQSLLVGGTVNRCPISVIQSESNIKFGPSHSCSEFANFQPYSVSLQLPKPVQQIYPNTAILENERVDDIGKSQIFNYDIPTKISPTDLVQNLEHSPNLSTSSSHLLPTLLHPHISSPDQPLNHLPNDTTAILDPTLMISLGSPDDHSTDPLSRGHFRIVPCPHCMKNFRNRAVIHCARCINTYHLKCAILIQSTQSPKDDHRKSFPINSTQPDILPNPWLCPKCFRNATICGICTSAGDTVVHSEKDPSMISCSYCSYIYHRHCLEKTSPSLLPSGHSLDTPWLCNNCRLDHVSMLRCKLLIGLRELRLEVIRLIHKRVELTMNQHKKNLSTTNKHGNSLEQLLKLHHGLKAALKAISQSASMSWLKWHPMLTSHVPNQPSSIT